MSSTPPPSPGAPTERAPVLRPAQRLHVRGGFGAAAEEILTAEATRFLLELHARFDRRRRELLAERPAFHERLAGGRLPELPTATEEIRRGDWKVAPPPADLQERKVEITGPVDRKLMINALNSGASVYMADFEDAHAPTWERTLAGQVDLKDAVRRRIRYTAPDGRAYRLVPRPAVLMVRPRGLHLEEVHAEIDGDPVSASLFDFGLYFFHNAHELLARGTGPYYYLPKLEHATEARLWDDIFSYAERTSGLPRGTVRATALLETLPAAFEIDEILWELRDHSAGLNCGRWDYIFSFLKQYRDDPGALLPDRAALSMDAPFLRAYARRVVERCHRRGAHALGGMAAQIPIPGDPAANAVALERVRRDKLREARLGHDGTWVAHPGLVDLAREVFDAEVPGPNQVGRVPEGPVVAPAELVEVPRGERSAAGLRADVRVALRYLEAWLRGIGCVPIDHLMEDAATVEIARAQLWQWIHHRAVLADGRSVTPDLFRRILREQADLLQEEREREGAWTDPRHRAELFLDALVTSEEFVPFFPPLALGLLDEVSEEAGLAAARAVPPAPPAIPLPAGR